MLVGLIPSSAPISSAVSLKSRMIIRRSSTGPVFSRWRHQYTRMLSWLFLPDLSDLSGLLPPVRHVRQGILLQRQVFPEVFFSP